jgi:hypothetical protein
MRAHAASDRATFRGMPSCIYNREPTTGTEPEEHPVPETLGGREALPKGAVCEPCNSYVGRLDQMLRTHPHISAFLVLAGVPGKTGKPRRDMAGGREGSAEYDVATGDTRIKTTQPYVSVSGTDIYIRHPGSEFDEWQFSRGLHKVGLGMIALRRGVNTALDERFDEVRTYVRRPASRKVFRRHYHRWISTTLRRSDINELASTPIAALGTFGGIETLYLRIGVDEFAIALTGDVTHVAMADVEELAASARAADDGRARTAWALEGAGN